MTSPSPEPAPPDWPPKDSLVRDVEFRIDQPSEQAVFQTFFNLDLKLTLQTTRFDEPTVIEKGHFKLGATVVMCLGRVTALGECPV
ncbi:hypothetical protein [Salinicola corii]|uniref:hypothetical protein n=1 Tax=Salinicola corii TaxID=2606937 RepID=UPI001EF153E4|nr:hypothetical protein [Salinicola corii]